MKRVMVAVRLPQELIATLRRVAKERKKNLQKPVSVTAIIEDSTIRWLDERGIEIRRQTETK